MSPGWGCWTPAARLGLPPAGRPAGGLGTRHPEHHVHFGHVTSPLQGHQENSWLNPYAKGPPFFAF